MCAVVSSAPPSSSNMVEEAQRRLIFIQDRIENLPRSKITDSCKQTLMKLATSELKFLSRLTSSGPISVNVGYLESVVHILEQSFVNGVSRVCKAVPLASQKIKSGSHSKGAHVDIICTVESKPVWFIVSDRNPKYISWSGSHRNKGLRMRIEQVLVSACSAESLKPMFIFLFFSNGLDDVVARKLKDEFGVTELGTKFSPLDCDIFTKLEGEWVYVIAGGKYTSRVFEGARAFQLKVGNVENMSFCLERRIQDQVLEASKPEFPENQAGLVLDDAFSSLIAGMRSTSVDVVSPDAMRGEAMVNFDTTALVALVSGISNGASERLLTTSEVEMRKHFKNNLEFVMAQVMSELQNPILIELRSMISGKRGIVCESVLSEFNELISMYGGPCEKSRANRLLKCILTVPDCPSKRMMGLPTTRKIALKNKIVFGTGDHWSSPTLTANMGFVRAISQSGMSLLTLEHRPRALVGD